jgi:hypothetical protein
LLAAGPAGPLAMVFLSNRYTSLSTVNRFDELQS